MIPQATLLDIKCISRSALDASLATFAPKVVAWCDREGSTYNRTAFRESVLDALHEANEVGLTTQIVVGADKPAAA